MSIILRTVLRGAIKTLIGSDWWDKVRETVANLADEDISGEEKRAMAAAFLKESGWRAASFLLNLAIEVAVLFLMAEQGKLED